MPQFTHIHSQRGQATVYTYTQPERTGHSLHIYIARGDMPQFTHIHSQRGHATVYTYT